MKDWQDIMLHSSQVSARADGRLHVFQLDRQTYVQRVGIGPNGFLPGIFCGLQHAAASLLPLAGREFCMRVIELGKCWKCGELYPKAMRAYVCWKCGACAATGRCHYCGAEIHSSDEACPKCGKVNGWALPDEGECWNCHLPLVPGAKYCTSCGLAVGTIALKPYPA